MAAITTTAVIGAASVANASYQGKKNREAAQRAANQQLAATGEAQALQQDAQATLRNDLSPYRQAGAEALPMLQQFAFDPSAQVNYLQNNPLFQASLNTADRATAARLATQGRIGTGDQSMQLQENYLLAASPLLQAQEQRLLNLSSLGQNAAAGIGNANLTAANNIGNLAAQGANAQAANIAAQRQASQQVSNQLLQTGGNLAGALLAQRQRQNAINTGYGYDFGGDAFN